VASLARRLCARASSSSSSPSWLSAPRTVSVIGAPHAYGFAGVVHALSVVGQLDARIHVAALDVRLDQADHGQLVLVARLHGGLHVFGELQLQAHGTPRIDEKGGNAKSR
jgi:hypothetical protein